MKLRAIAAFLLRLSLVTPLMAAEPREVLRLDTWEFLPAAPLPAADQLPTEDAAEHLSDEAAWQEVKLPHAFRQQALADDQAAWYRRSIEVDDLHRRHLLHVEGAGSVSDIYVNGQRVGRHRGAFTAAVYDLSPSLKPGTNHVAIRVSNGDAEANNCLSHSTLFVTSGGLFRPVWWIETGPVSFEPFMGSSGLFLTGKNIEADSADLEIKAHVRNTLDHPVELLARSIVTGPDGDLVAELNVTSSLPAGATQPLVGKVAIAHPQRWAPGHPRLYQVTTTLLVDGQEMDRVSESTGLRTVAIDDGRFLINGEELLVRGVNKHQQTELEWNAIPEQELVHEWDLLEDMGVNTVRLAHYPHRRFEYHEADRRGIAIWAENGLAGQLWQHEVTRDSGEREPSADGDRITREMVFQNWNHPSIIFWSSGNETYERVAAHYADIIRENDTSRLVTYASAHTDRPDTVDFIAGNTYQGWYSDHFTGFRELPRNRYVSETGAGTWPSQHIPQNEARWKVNEFEPMEYGNLFTEYRLETVFRSQKEEHKMYLWWNFREFYDRKFKNNRNTKGMITLAGTPKDVYYLHKAFFRPDLPILHIASRDHFYRWFAPNNGTKVFSNADWVELRINGKLAGRQQNGDYRQPAEVYPKDWQGDPATIHNVFFWNTPLDPGKNILEVTDSRGETDRTVVYQWTATEAENPWISDLRSSNPDNKAHFIDRPIAAQAPFYYMVDGSADNTFDDLPTSLEGASWIATKRLSDPTMKTDLSFTLKKDATVMIMHSTGTFPAMVLRQPDPATVAEADALSGELSHLGFTRSPAPARWRGHDLWLADATVWSRPSKAGDTIKIPGHTLDSVILLKE
ncbi:beta-galactosidase [Haloferula luteola]|uniref:Beta-galactosidase n=1 Tax=Haloferula luteola TaxID=595692 RepID=A0A840V2K6_9BACT|nr:glycoside hydrolase family 2 TIM barrel-domain containing protein [Haloferula luteola]MBB5351703.1 beta-galactosidase [Haloferula luteola]